ncbi:MAG: hypothetical protein CME13_07635 [Gemmatimonadetes bacterium]|nr:hypothetical protein [Gemmatimonadota bacterium]
MDARGSGESRRIEWALEGETDLSWTRSSVTIMIRARHRGINAGERNVRTIFVGDLHGCAAEFEALLEAVSFDRSTCRLLLTGDAFSRGPEPHRVWELILDTGAEMVLGNHDARLLQQFEANDEGDSPTFKKPDQRICFDALLPIVDALLPWLKAIPLKIDEPSFLLVHAGVHPVDSVEGTSRDEFLTIRTWPPTGGIEGPRWHDVIDPLADHPIIFGHDAPGGLVVKRPSQEQPPWAVGLDSGCIYGGALSAYLLDEARVVQVPSQQGGARRWF